MFCSIYLRFHILLNRAIRNKKRRRYVYLYCTRKHAEILLCYCALGCGIVRRYTDYSRIYACFYKSYDKIKTSDDIVSFLSQFGWEVDGTPLEEVKIRIPMEFDKVMNSYNELQRGQGLDLSKYRGKEVTRYTFRVKNYPDYDGEVMANVIIYKTRVIGGDLCSSDVRGFICGFGGVKAS